MVTIFNICGFFSLEKVSSWQKKKNESLTCVGKRHKITLERKYIYFFIQLCVCVVGGGEGLKKTKKIIERKCPCNL